MSTRKRSQELFVKVDTVMADLGVSKPYAYKVISELNEELKKSGFIVINGRIPRAYYEEKIYGMSEICEDKWRNRYGNSKNRT